LNLKTYKFTSHHKQMNQPSKTRHGGVGGRYLCSLNCITRVSCSVW